jgi:hypothetical protein
MYAIYGNIYHQYTPNVSNYIYTIHGSYGLGTSTIYGVSQTQKPIPGTQGLATVQAKGSILFHRGLLLQLRQGPLHHAHAVGLPQGVLQLRRGRNAGGP